MPADSAALAVGTKGVAAAVAAEAAERKVDLRIPRNGSRGLFWLEPLVEVEAPEGRIAYGPVRAEDVPGLFDAGFLGGRGQGHPLCLGLAEEILFLKRQGESSGLFT